MGEIMEKAVRKKKDICSYTYEELAEEMQAAGEIARIMQESGPEDPLHDEPPDPEEESRQRWDQDPPF